MYKQLAASNMTLVISPYQTEYAAMVATLWYKSWLTTNPPDPETTSIADLRRRLETETHTRWRAFVAKRDEVVVGMLALAPSEGRLDQVFVAPSNQRTGIGRQLLNFSKKELPTGFWLHVDATNLSAQTFYTKEGLIQESNQENFSARKVIRYRWVPED